LEWGSIAESISDLANTIICNNDWYNLTFHSPARHFVPKKVLLDNDILFEFGRYVIINIPVDIPVNLRGTVALN
jgi:hypothetical protein